jgi:hypothetical protein
MTERVEPPKKEHTHTHTHPEREKKEGRHVRIKKRQRARKRRRQRKRREKQENDIKGKKERGAHGSEGRDSTKGGETKSHERGKKGRGEPHHIHLTRQHTKRGIKKEERENKKRGSKKMAFAFQSFVSIIASS